MTDYSKIKMHSGSGVNQQNLETGSSNPLYSSVESSDKALSGYSQSLPRNTYDEDMAELLEVVRILNNMAPLRMPVYNFHVDEINGEVFLKPDGTRLLIREYDSDLVRDYYISASNPENIERILEHDRFSGRLRTRIEPNSRPSSRSKINITIFDERINRKYTLMQLAEDGIVNNITEFSGKGQAFKTLYRNIKTFKPARYLEGKDNPEKGFEMVDCIFDNDGNIVRIKRYNSKKELDIQYTDDRKNITVKNK